MKTAEEIYKKHYLEKFKYDYPDGKAMARHLKEIALDAMEEYAEAHYNQKLAEMMPSQEDIRFYAKKAYPFEEVKSTNTGDEPLNYPNRWAFMKGVYWLQSLLTQEEK